jgi:DNA-binding XRE family transcriptional regulator
MADLALSLRSDHEQELRRLTQTNRAFHRMLRDGVPVEYPRPDGSIAGDHVRLVDFGEVRANDWLAVNQFTVIEGQHNRRPDIVVFVNGLPLAVIELKNATDENATIWSAFNQLQTYKQQIGSLFNYNEVLVVSDGTNARIGSLTANQEWFKVWRTIDGEGDAPKSALELEVLVRGVFLGIKHGARAMKSRGGGGSIVNTGSIAGISGGSGPQAYSAAKAAVLNQFGGAQFSSFKAALIELRLKLAEGLKARRKRKRLTQHDLAAAVQSSQSRVAKMESGDPTVSIDLLMRSLIALGASRRDLARIIAPS